MKRIKKADLKHAKMSYELQDMVDDINRGGTYQEGALFILNPCCDASKERREAMRELLYSLVICLKSNDAWHVFTEIAYKIGTCQQFVERWLRGDERVEIYAQFGQNYIGIKDDRNQ
jgi:hypothetical protein